MTDQTDTTPAATTAAPDMGTPEGVTQVAVQTLLQHPAQIPAKFKDAEGNVNVDALTASYLELERQRSGIAPSAPATPDAAPTTPSLDTSAESAATNASEEPVSLADALDDPPAPEGAKMWEVINAEFAATGTLSDASAKMLIDSGAAPAILATFNAGRQALAANSMTAAAELLGGKDQLDATLAWAKANLTDAEKASIKPLLSGPQAATVLLGMQSRRMSANPESGQVNTANVAGSTLPAGNPNANLKPFRDWNEQQAAMRAPEYKTDPEYRAECEARLMLGAGFEIER